MNRKFWIAALITFINALSATILIPTIYLYAKQFNLTDFQAGCLLSMFAVAQFFATPVIGKLSDRFGRKPLLMISLTGTVIANFLAGTAPNAVVLFAARGLDGITGGNVSVAQAIISDVTKPEERAKGFGIFGAAFGLGFVLGPAISLLAQQISLGASFLASSGMAAIALVLTVLFLPETLAPEGRSRQINLFDLGFSELIRGFTLPKIGLLLLLNFLIGTTFTIFTFGFQPYYINVLKQDNRSLTLLFCMIGILGVLAQTKGVSWLTQRTTLTRILFAGILVRSLAFLCMPLWPDIRYFVEVSIVFAMFNAMVQPMISTLISLNVKPEEQGISSGLNASYLSIANGIGPIIAGSMVNEQYPITYSYPLFLAGFLNLGILWLAVRTRKQYTPTAMVRR
ncbi:MFS transporter [Alkalinema pantanalense CENA528]|uniref:MFS transporter n=1 Tax=Alkalinema pantanalense TaxID=1620705 RepID=UPI003D6F3416